MKIIGLEDKYLQDLNYFLEYADKKRGIENDEQYPYESFHLNFYLNHSKEELYNYINDYLSQYSVDDDDDFYYMLKSIIKYMSGFSDSHTMIHKNNNVWFPIRFKVINNNVFIDRCFDKNFLRDKIIKINGIDIEQIIYEIINCTSYGTNGWLLTNIEKMLSNKNDLLSLPSLCNQDGKIIFETNNNETITFDINNDYNGQIMYPQNISDQYKIIDNIFIFRYPLCKIVFEPDLNIIEDLIKINNIEKFVLDLRGNNGGDSKIIQKLIEFLTNKELELFTIVDRGVFSSGRFAAIDMKRIGSKIIGEDIGTPINCFGYVSGSGITPNSKINFHFAKVYWYEEDGFMKGIYTKEELEKQSKEFFKPKHLQIDIPIEINEIEYINSLEDIFFNKCIEAFKTNSRKK